MAKSPNSMLVSCLSLVCLTLACAQTSNAVTSAPAVSTLPPATNSASTPTVAAQVPTIVFAEHHNTGWNHIPTLVIVGKRGDARFAAVEQAIQWWNGQLQNIGTPFHFGSVTENYSVDPDQLVPANLRSSDPSDPGNPVTGALPQGADSLGADIIIALTSYDLTSRNMIKLTGTNIGRDVILMKNFDKAGMPQGNSSPGAPQHELGHAIGLMHDSSTNSIMCGPPWNNQKGCLGRKGQIVLDQDQQYILSLYPSGWTPSP